MGWGLRAHLHMALGHRPFWRLVAADIGGNPYDFIVTCSCGKAWVR